MQFYVPQLSNAPWDKYERIKCTCCGAAARAGDKIRYHDSKKVSKTHQSYHILLISERIITHTSQNKRYDGIRKG